MRAEARRASGSVKVLPVKAKILSFQKLQERSINYTLPVAENTYLLEEPHVEIISSNPKKVGSFGYR